jgi:hypothetical protein
VRSPSADAEYLGVPQRFDDTIREGSILRHR